MSPQEKQQKDSEEEESVDREKKLEKLKSLVFDQGKDAAQVLKMWLHNSNDNQ